MLASTAHQVEDTGPATPGMTLLRLAVIILATFFAYGCASDRDGFDRSILGPGPGGSYKVGRPYQVNGVWYYPAEDPGYDRVGMASWYGHAFHGRRTANGEVFNKHRMTAAHPTLPMPVLVRVTNLNNGRSLVLRVNDRGPFVAGRIIDVSQGAAEALGFRQAGVARVRVQFVGRADGAGVPVAGAPVGAPDVTPASAQGGTPPVGALGSPWSMNATNGPVVARIMLD